MAVKINIHQNLQHLTNDQDIVEVEGNMVSQCLDHLVKQFPDIKRRYIMPYGTGRLGR